MAPSTSILRKRKTRRTGITFFLLISLFEVSVSGVGSRHRTRKKLASRILSSQFQCLVTQQNQKETYFAHPSPLMPEGDDDNADPEYIQILQNYEQYAQHGALDLEDQERAEEEEEEEEEEEDEEEEDEDHGEDEEYVPAVELHGVSRNGPIIHEALEYGVEEAGYKRRRTGGGEACSSTSQDNEWSRSEIDGLFCPICMEAWTADGGHHICCLPCGHIYGMSCINKWLKQRKNSGKGADWCKKEAEWKKREAELHVKVCQLSERKIYLENLLKDMQSRPSGAVKAGGNHQGRSVFGQNFGSAFCGQESSRSFILQKEFWLDGARLIDVDASSEILLIVRRRSEMGATSVLTKMSLMPPHEKEDIFLPSNMKVIKDLCISPSNGSLVLFASLGQKLSVLRFDTVYINCCFIFIFFIFSLQPC
ncbi:hypothetical protein I3842_09G171900 [Carya illinoinensis]|uniref:RING-type domain-containing protein n=1 Tax=Carya illinoinensis TaxID=32201 RepID=A0A922E6Y6_CARIL|nr:hypothetical protein I3842_09G171900 [Carya illinoinensis]